MRKIRVVQNLGPVRTLLSIFPLNPINQGEDREFRKKNELEEQKSNANSRGENSCSWADTEELWFELRPLPGLTFSPCD